MTEQDFYGLSKEAAGRAISENVAVMQRLYNDIIRMADYHDLRVSVVLEFPEDIGRLGHNASMKPEVYWNPSSKYC